MYERSAIVLERYFSQLFGMHKENNIVTNFQNYCETIKEITEYAKIETEEENVIEKFDIVASEIEELQKKQSKIHESNIELEEERNTLFNDFGENPNTLDNKLRKIEDKLDKNNGQLKELRETYMKALIIFTERQRERNKNARIKRTAEANHINKMENSVNYFKNIDKKSIGEIKKFIGLDKTEIEKNIIDLMIKNGKNEKIAFNQNVIKKAVKERISVAIEEAELYISVYEKMKKLINEIGKEETKIGKYEKTARDVTVKLNFLKAKKEYIFDFLDNERMTILNGKKMHEKLMEEACENFDVDVKQINNLYELIIKETTSKATKKAYKDLYNKNYLRDIEQNERHFEQEITNIKINMGTVINSNYWRIEGIKNIYKVFLEEVSDKFGKDLSEFKVEEIEEAEIKEKILPGINNVNNRISGKILNYKADEDEEYEDEQYDDEYDDDYYDDDYDDEEYDDEEYDDEEYDDEEYDDEEYDDEDYDNEDEQEDDEVEEDFDEDKDDDFLSDNIDEIIRNSRKKGLFGKLFNK